MAVYADILVLVNWIVDYFLLGLTAGLLQRKISPMRQIAAALIAGLSSLILFLPDLPGLLNLGIIAAVGAVVCFAAFGFGGWLSYGRCIGLFFGITLLWGGSMFALWSCLHPAGMTVQNGVVYFNISPLFLIGFSAAAYLILMLLRKLFRKRAPNALRCEITVTADGKSVTLCAIADTGHSLSDGFGLSEIIIADPAAVHALFGADRNAPALQRRYRLLPCTTVSGEDLLEGYRCDRARVCRDKKTVILHHPVLALSKTPLGPDYSAVVSPKIFD